MKIFFIIDNLLSIRRINTLHIHIVWDRRRVQNKPHCVVCVDGSVVGVCITYVAFFY